MICRVALEGRSESCKHKLINLRKLLKPHSQKLRGYISEINLAITLHTNRDQLDDHKLRLVCILSDMAIEDAQRVMSDGVIDASTT